MSIIAAVLVLLLPLVNAHGFMVWPISRYVPGDTDNGYSFARAASPDPCHGVSQGSVLTPALTGGSAVIDYVITAPHLGGCTVYIDRGNGWETIGYDPSCGTSAHTGQIQVTIPSGDYNAVIRWFYKSENGSGELFNTCSDITVSSTGTNAHTADVVSFAPCTQLDDRQCTGTSLDITYQQCAAVLNGVGTWFQKSCAEGKRCVQTIASDPARGILGAVACGYGNPVPAPSPDPSPSPSVSPSPAPVSPSPAPVSPSPAPVSPSPAPVSPSPSLSPVVSPSPVQSSPSPSHSPVPAPSPSPAVSPPFSPSPVQTSPSPVISTSSKHDVSSPSPAFVLSPSRSSVQDSPSPSSAQDSPSPAPQPSPDHEVASPSPASNNQPDPTESSAPATLAAGNDASTGSGSDIVNGVQQVVAYRTTAATPAATPASTPTPTNKQPVMATSVAANGVDTVDATNAKSIGGNSESAVDGGLSSGAIVAIVFGSLAVVGLGTAILAFIQKRKRANSARSDRVMEELAQDSTHLLFKIA
ncbi:UNVERIFIED_CONTAM: hypothetical protein HDU68_007053 [Siphonaria sp. JEL0065]|nr:hypothetical protein HDU68_007053 [Siphonaria sp. JEL0065]